MWPFTRGKALGPSGEADIIALQGPTRECPAQTIVFVEVKTRSSDRYTDPSSAVDSEKQRRIRKTAKYYLNTRPSEGYNVRFDIVAIVLPEGQDPQIEYFPNAF